MKKLTLIFTSLIAGLALTSCLKENCGCDPKFDQPVLFQYEYVNYAWGFRHHGFLIDDKGNVNCFRSPQNWIKPDSSGMMSKLDLEYNLAQCDTIWGKVSLDSLKSNFNQIEKVRDGKIVDYGDIMADAGTGILSAWYFNEKEGKYESVFLVSNGDINQINSHSSVEPIVDWLKSVGERTDRFYWFGGK
jgi:hypothetical protein